MKNHILWTIIALIASSTALSAQGDDLCRKAPELQKAVEAIVSDPALSMAVTSICATTGDSIPLVDIDADNMVMPASNMKLISTGAALHCLGPEHRYTTGIGNEIVYSILMRFLYYIIQCICPFFVRHLLIPINVSLISPAVLADHCSVIRSPCDCTYGSKSVS